MPVPDGRLSPAFAAPGEVLDEPGAVGVADRFGCCPLLHLPVEGGPARPLGFAMKPVLERV